MKKIWLSSPHMGENELKYVIDAFETNWIAPVGPAIEKFESDLCSYLNIKSAAVLSSGTAAIHLSLKLLNVEQGDYVICQSMTFAASANPIKYCGGIPVFVDSEKLTWNMDPDLLVDAIQYCLKKGKKPKAIIVVHLYGMPACIDDIIKISEKYEIPVIEDAAEALGSTHKGKMCGTFGKIGILSFNGNKIITTGGGGALVSNDMEIVARAKYLATQARDNTPHYQHTEIGYNYRMSNIAAAIGRGQMEVIDLRIKQRRENFNIYFNKLSHIDGIQFQDEIKDSFSNRWLTALLIKDENLKDKKREVMRINLNNSNIESRPLWKPMHLQPIFRDAPSFKNGVSEELFNTGLCLPSGSNLCEDQLNEVIKIINNSL